MTQHQLITQAIELSQQILEAIDNSDLELVATHEKNRQLLIKDYFNKQGNIDEKLTRSLKQLNDEIVSKLAQIQSQVRSEHIKLSHGSKASKAYLNNTGT